MNVQRIQLVGAYGHTNSTVELPATGIVTVTGPNGSGKSGLFLEAVSVALWGKTLRGAPAWPDSGTAKVSVVVDGLEVERLRAKGKTTLNWRARDGTELGKAIDARVRLGGIPANTDGAGGFETATKAQEALDTIIEPFDVWRRTRALSSADAAHFSLATDAERKRLLEGIVGLERFDNALQACRDDLSTAVARRTGKLRDRDRAELSLQHERHTLAGEEMKLEAFEAEAPPALPKPTGKTAEEFRRLLEGARQHVAELRTALRENADVLATASRAGGAADAEAERASRLHDRLVQQRDCPACGQDIAHDHLERLRTKAHADRQRAAKERMKAAADVERLKKRQADELDPELAEAEHIRAALENKLAARTLADREYAAREAERGRWAGARELLVEAVAEAGARVENATSALAEADGGLAAATREVELLQTVEQVLGIRGVRVQLLARALGGIEAVANTWLARLGLPGLGLRLRPYTEKKTGGQSDAIGLEVAGAGGGHGYRAASAGERRRIDLAVLLALGEVAAAARGTRPGTLLFDELFDALDVDGVAAVSTALEELAQDRCVVVVSHNQDLVAALPAVRTYHVEGGTVS